ncbi:hypothetical protein C8R44DRAFT_870945 [Mycena epipterygia]|nr:hypothetical protein C8R44DRAFT_870945 [Mycena epipterygia]
MTIKPLSTSSAAMLTKSIFSFPLLLFICCHPAPLARYPPTPLGPIRHGHGPTSPTPHPSSASVPTLSGLHPPVPITPYNRKNRTHPKPVGDYVLVRSIYDPTAAIFDPAATLSKTMAEIARARPELQGIRTLTTAAARLADSTSCYIHLHNSHLADPTAVDATEAEPRVDLLQRWVDALHADAPQWETVWVPQHEGKDKRMWVKLYGVFDEVEERTKKVDDKVISTIRKALNDMAGLRLGV